MAQCQVRGVRVDRKAVAGRLADLKEWTGLTIPDLVTVPQDRRTQLSIGSLMQSHTPENGYDKLHFT